MRCCRDAAAVETVIGLAEAALTGQYVQLVLKSYIQLLGSQRRRNRLYHVPLLRVLRKQIETPVVVIKRRFVIFPPCGGHFDHHHHGAVLELIDVTVVGTVNAAQNVDCICIHRDTNRKQVIKIVCDVRSVDDELSLVASRMYHRGDSLKARNIRQKRIGKRFVFVSVNAVLDDVKSVFVFPVNLQIQIVFSSPCDHAVKSTL